MQHLIYPRVRGISVALAVVVLLLSLQPVRAAGAISGTVFRDFDFDAIQDVNEPPIQGIQVFATDDLGNVTPTVITAVDGTYTLATLLGDNARVEFVIPPALSFLQPGRGSLAGGDSGFSSEQFVDISGGDVAGIDLGLNNAGQYCHTDNPEIVTSCFVYGEHDEEPFTTNGFTFDPGPATAMLSFDYLSTDKTISEGGNYNRQAEMESIGTVWGTAYHPQSDTVLVAAFTKRHSGFGPNGPGAIYSIGMNRAGNAPGLEGDVNLWADLNAVSGNTFVDPHTPVPDPSGNLFLDVGAFNGVGTTSLGDLDLNQLGDTVYVSDLQNRGGSGAPLLYQMSLNEDGTYGGNTNTITYPVPVTGVNGVVQGCTATDLRAGALKYNNGSLYAALTCAPLYAYDANDPDNPPNDQLRAYIYQYVPTAGWTATPVAEFDLNYPRGDASSGGGGGLPAEWQAWALDTDNVIDADDYDPEQPFGQQGRPQPLLTDIEIDERGFMIIGITDRTGHQTGNDNGLVESGTVEGVSAGDILRLTPDNQTNPSSWTVESNASDGTVTTAGAGNGEGPGGGEFYVGDGFGAIHDEVTLGGLTLLPGSNEVMSNVFDPLIPGNPFPQDELFRSGGVRTFSHADGQVARAAEIFAIDAPGTFGKAAGIGDVEMLCGLAPVEIGNRVWFDTDADGIQDPEEIGIAGVVMELYIDSNGDGVPDLLVGETITNASGEWLFSINNINLNEGPNLTFRDINGNGVRDEIEPLGIISGLNYEVRVDTTQPALIDFALTLQNQNGDASNDNQTDVNDSDAILSDLLAVISFVGGAPGENNHTLDIGFTIVPDPTETPTPTNTLTLTPTNTATSAPINTPIFTPLPITPIATNSTAAAATALTAVAIGTVDVRATEIAFAENVLSQVTALPATGESPFIRLLLTLGAIVGLGTLLIILLNKLRR